MKQKKGISPLIATVLLIGFTIVLAALVFRFGGNLFRTTTEETACSSLIILQCAQSTDFKIEDVVLDTTAQTLAIKIENKNEGIISGFVFVIKPGNADTETVRVDGGPGLPLLGFNTATYNVGYLEDELPTIEVTPIIERTDPEGNICSGACIQQKEIFKPGVCGNNEVEPGEDCEQGQKQDCEGPGGQDWEQKCSTTQCIWLDCRPKDDADT